VSIHRMAMVLALALACAASEEILDVGTEYSSNALVE
jgi:hypothetical protein